MEGQNTQTRLAIWSAQPNLWQRQTPKEKVIPVRFQVEPEKSMPIADWLATDDEIGCSQDQIVLTLDDHGMIRSCNKGASKLMGCPISLLAWRHISSLLPQLADMAITKDGQINPRLRFLARIGHEFQLVAPDGKTHSAQIYISDVESYHRHFLRLIICSKQASTPTQQ